MSERTNESDIAAVTEVVRAYYDGMMEGDEAKLARAFHPRACIVGNGERGELYWVTLDEFVDDCQKAVAQAGPHTQTGTLSGHEADIVARLSSLSPDLATSLEQALVDVTDVGRRTYVAPAGEAREVMRAAIHRLSPDAEVRKHPWYRETTATRPKPSAFVMRPSSAGQRRPIQRLKRPAWWRNGSAVSVGLYTSGRARHCTQEHREPRRVES